MSHEEFIETAKTLVAEHTNARGDFEIVSPEEVFVVWSSKALQNSKAMMSTPALGSLYYEITMNGDKSEIYFDVYEKRQNKRIKINRGEN